MKEQFIDQLKTFDIQLSDQQFQQFQTYYEVLIEWNQKMNLTSITDLEGVFYKHFLDSVSVIKAMKPDKQKLLDVGSGAGFPSIPLRIIFPGLEITIIDSLQKRITFLEHLCKELHIKAILIHGRVEDFEKREAFDIVTARAVANLTMLSELCIPFVSLDGYFIALKGPNYKEEVVKAQNAIKILGGSIEEVIEYTLLEQERSLVKIKKINITPNKYPRHFGKIKNKPL